jgi:hypothetical protein
MRLKSELWVQAFLRRNAIAGRFGAVVRRGASEAGTIYIVINHLDGTHHLFGPPPGSAIDEQGDRQWIAELSPPADSEAVNAFIARRAKFDPDIWVVEAEDRAGTAGLAAQAN